MRLSIIALPIPLLGVLLVLSPFRGVSQIQVVNMVPLLQSNQTSHDAEPNLAVNPANALHIVATAFTPDPMGGPNAPIYISTDGGNTWALNSIIPGNDPTYGTGDITTRFSGSSNQLYVGDLKGGEYLTLNILRVPDYTSGTLAELMVNRDNVDQPYVQATTVLGGSGTGSDRVYITTNDWNSMPQPAAANLSLDAFSAAAPDGFATNLFPNRPNTVRVMPGVRPSIHASGVIYMAFYNSTAAGADVVVARDDNWASGGTPFQNLLDGTDGLPGQRVVTARNLPAFGVNLGNNRLVASNISVAVDPENSATVYVAWADRVGTTDYTLHVQSSVNSGQNWSGDLLTITNATNPALAVNINSKLGFLYQQLTGSGAAQRWETHLRRSIDGGVSWDDITLSTALLSDPGSFLGDYEHLLAVGQDFYGVFTASNYPDMANFPQGITYLRNANWTTHQILGTDGTTVIAGSLDPFFFHVTELPAASDFYVRDFTNTPTDFDPGLEPSTDPWFFVSSDVWNMRSNSPGTFNANDQPQSEDPWQTTDGQNFAFARVHRKAAGSPQTVTLHYLYSEFGTGSNFVDANSTPDPTLSFGASDLEMTPTSGYEWDLPVTTSNHTCLAVQISAPGDAIIPPSLLGHTPGWGTGTDLMVLNDNNKAQRNMEVYRVPMGGSSGGTGSASAMAYAAIHNPGIEEADMILNWKADSIAGARIRPALQVVGGDKRNVGTDNGITLTNMQPGETRFLRISYPPAGTREGVQYPVVMGQARNGVILNGFTIAQQSSSMINVAAQNLRYEASVCRRIGQLYPVREAGVIQKADLAYLEKRNSAAEEYPRLVEKNMLLMHSIVSGLLKNGPDDAFGLTQALARLEAALKDRKDADAAILHLSLLNAIDAFATSLQLAKGNTADYLQTIYVEKDVAVLLSAKKIGTAGPQLLSASNEFIHGVEAGKLSLKNYANHVKDVVPGLKECSANLADHAALINALNNMEKSLNDAAALQRQHMDFLLTLRNTLRSLK